MNTQPVTVIATFQARPGKEAELRTLLAGLVAPTRKEAGCLNYDLHCSAEDSAKFLFHENWVSKTHLDAHLQSPHIKALLPCVDGLCAGSPQVTIWERIN
jgi:quinol monooxygenase YgiN